MRVLTAVLILIMLAAAPAGGASEQASAEGEQGQETPVSEEELEEFVPTEEVPADSAISFPVDI